MFDYKSQKSYSILPGMMWAANFCTTWSCCILTLGNKVLSALLCLCPELNPYYTFNCLWAFCQGVQGGLFQVCWLSQYSLHPKTSCLAVGVFESEDEFGALISAFVFCFVISITGKSNQQDIPGGHLSVPGMQNHRFLRFSSLHSYPSFPICSKLICRL